MGSPERTAVDRRQDRVPFGILLFLIIFCPLAFGTVELWSQAIMESAALVCLSLLLFRAVRHPVRQFYEVPGMVPLLLLLGFIFLQTVSLPPAVVKIISPGTYAIYEQTVWAGEPGSWVSLSISRKATIAEFFRYASYAAVYVSALQLLTKEKLLKRTITVLISFAALLAFFSMLQHLVSNNRIYWFRELSQGGTLFGPYVNRNHYAGLMGMIFPVILSLFLLYRPPSKSAPLRKRIAETFNHPMTNIHLLLGFSAILTAASIFVSLSRGGIASLSMSLVFLGVLLKKKVDMHRRGPLLIITVIIILYAVGWFGWGPIFERFRSIRTTQGDISELRLDIWKDSAGIIRDFPLTGTGFGSFIHVYPAYRTLEPEGIADHAHNDIIEFLTDGGIISLLLVAWFMAAVLRRSFRAYAGRKDPLSLYLYSGSITGILSILLHSFTDFNLQIGANGLYLFFFLALAVSASHTGMQEDTKGTLLQRTGIGGSRPFLALTVAVLALCCLFNTGQLFGVFLNSEVRGIRIDGTTPRATLAAARDTLRRASFFDPHDASYQYRTAVMESLLQNNAEGHSRFQRSLLLQPLNSQHLRAYGLFLSKTGDGERAEKLLRAAITYDRTNPVVHTAFGTWLIGKGKTDEGLNTVKTAISLEPARTAEYISLLVLTGLSDQKIQEALPDAAQPHFIFAHYLEKTGRDDMAADEYEQAVAYTSREKNPAPAYFHSAYRYYRARGRNESAVDVMNKGIQLFPKDVPMRLMIAETYEAIGRRGDAAEQYRQIIGVDPKNARAVKKLEELR